MVNINGRWYETSLLFEKCFNKVVKRCKGANGICMCTRGVAMNAGRNTRITKVAGAVAFFESSLP
jgi:hypothetical protein